MQIFFSHSTRQKPLVREIIKHLPSHLSAWIDEEKLLFGDSIPQSLETSIKHDSDYVLLFIDEYAAESNWVFREIDLAIQAEISNNRTILLPVVIDEGALLKMVNNTIKSRKYLRLTSFLESSVLSLAENIASELFALVCRDMQQLRNPKPKRPIDTIVDGETLLNAQAAVIQKAVFPHRRSNPISKDKLAEVMRSLGGLPVAENEFETILSSIVQRNLIPGLAYDGFEAFLIEEHASWKAAIHHEKKERIGKKAARLIQNGTKVFLDAGSTIEEVVYVIIKKIENRAINRLLIATTSINIGDMISDCCVKMGFDDEFSAVKLFIPGGQVRPNTQAIIPAFGDGPRQILTLSDTLGGFDLCFVGVNGVDVDAGFTTHDNSEATNKIDIMNVSKSRVLVGDSSKVGIILDYKVADFDDKIRFVVDQDPTNTLLRSLIERYEQKIILA